MSDINMTPFIDVMLVLLIIFMVAAPLLATGVPLDLPQTKAAALNIDKQPLMVSLKSDGKLYLMDTAVGADELVPRLAALAPDALVARLDAAVGADGEGAALDAHVLPAVHAFLDPHAVSFGERVIGVGQQREGQAVLLRELFRGDEHRGGAIGKRRRGAGGDRSVLTERGLQAAQRFDGGVVEAKVEDGLHHAGHRYARPGAHGHEQRILGVSEAAPGVGLELRQCGIHFRTQGGRDAAAGRGSPLEQALNIGLGRAAYESAVDYAKIRVQGGRPIIEHQAVGNILAEIAIRLETSRSLVWKAAYAADHAGEYASISELPLQIMAKAYVSHAVHEAALLAAECFGAMGVMKDMPQPHYVHNALVFVHSDTSNSTAKLRVAEAIAEFKRG